MRGILEVPVARRYRFGVPPRTFPAARRPETGERPTYGMPARTGDDETCEAMSAGSLAPEEGFEPPTRRLTAACSTTELLRKNEGPIDDVGWVGVSSDGSDGATSDAP